MRINRSQFFSQDGITLIEVLVSIIILGIALGAISFLFTTNLLSADSLRNDTIASGLVQEGMEVVRNIRDREWLATTGFGTTIPNGTYEVQWDSTSLMPSSSRFLREDPSTGVFSYGAGNDTIFKRTITISSVSANEKVITTAVTWNTRTGQKSVNSEVHLFNWY